MPVLLEPVASMSLRPASQCDEHRSGLVMHLAGMHGRIARLAGAGARYSNVHACEEAASCVYII